MGAVRCDAGGGKRTADGQVACEANGPPRGENQVRSTRVVTLVTLALLNVFTLAAGVSVARMLPARLAAMKVPTAVAGATRTAASLLQSPSAGAELPTEDGLGNALRRTLGASLPGSQTEVMVADADTGRVLLDDNGETEATPGSVTKVATATAALATLGANARFTTRVVQTGTGIVLVGGGDPDLAVRGYPASDYPQPATLADLASQTAAALKKAGKTTVQLFYDTSLYSGSQYAPGWTSSDVTTGNVTPIVSLEVDQGRLTAGGAPEDDDDGTNFRARTTTPAAMADLEFSQLLNADGIKTSLTNGSVTAPASAATIASVSSPTVAQLVEQMLTESNNVIAENLGRHIAIAAGQPTTFAGAAAAIEAKLRGLGVTAGMRLVDASGLSPDDGIAPAALIETLQTAMRTSGLRAAITGLPVAGFDGTLSTGGSIFGAISGAARGVVRAKTGNLTNVATLAGLVTDSGGRLLVFAIMTGGYPVARLQAAADAVDAAATALAACGCR
jgi:D-alanyl-D-alanine carboxypeptidase/D-alanyl-D-alanine-endopeptidase (penicillin-binding protein 4)